MLDGRAPDRAAQLRAALPSERLNLPAPFRWENDQIVAELPHARAVFSTAAAASPRGRTPR